MENQLLTGSDLSILRILTTTLKNDGYRAEISLGANCLKCLILCLYFVNWSIFSNCNFTLISMLF